MVKKVKAKWLGIQFREALNQIKKLWWIVLVFNVAAVLVLLAAWLVGLTLHLDFGLLTRDPAATVGFHPLYGAISTFGILLWCASATLCFFSSFLFKDRIFKGSHRYLFFAGLLSLGLLLDDLFMIHEDLVPGYLGIDQNYVYAFYILVALVYFIYFSKSILKTEFIILLVSLFYIALSVFIDFIGEMEFFRDRDFTSMEDGLKFLGIATWFVYHLRLSAALARSNKPELAA